MAIKYTRISVSLETKELFNRCLDDFKRRKKLEDVFISEDVICRKICETYLRL